MDLSESSPSRRVRRRRLFSFLTAAGVVTGYVGCGFPDHTFIDDDEFYGRAGSGNGGSSGSGFDAGPDSSVSTGGVTTGGAGGTGGGGGSGGGTGGVIGTGGALDAGGDAKVCPTGGCPLECGQLTDCNGECVSVQTDERHCGFCDTPCDPGESCTDGQCLGLCVTGDNCDGVCVDTDMDERYCGNCTTACGAGEYCAFGICATGCAVSEDLGSAVGRPVTSGTTAGATDAIAAPCQSNDSAEVAYRWTAPVDGTFTIDTLGSTLSDTILWVSDGNCGGPLLACSDDAFLRRSRVEVPLTEGQVIVIYVDAYGGATGNFQLNIELGVDGPCCAPQNTLGCAADSNVESCVCDIRSCCCGSGGGPLCEPKWNFVCTNIALTQCNACAVN